MRQQFKRGAAFAASLFVSLGLAAFYAFVPVLYILYEQFVSAFFAIPIYFAISWAAGVEFSLQKYAVYALTIAWVWNSFRFTWMFILEVVLGIRHSDKKNSLLGLSDVKDISILLFCTGMSLLYLNPVVLYLNQVSISNDAISPTRAALYSINQFIDIATANLLSSYSIPILTPPTFKANFFSQTYAFLTNAGLQIITIGLVWGGLRALFLPSKVEEPAEGFAQVEQIHQKEEVSMEEPGNAAEPTDLGQHLRDRVQRLEDLSLTFSRRWIQSNERQYQLISDEALNVLADIVNHLIPQANKKVRLATEAGQIRWTAFDQEIGIWSCTIPSDQLADVLFPLGTARLPANASVKPVKLVAALQKLADLNPAMVGFRFESGRHIVLFGIAGSDLSAFGVLEIDINNFCAVCLNAIDEI